MPISTGGGKALYVGTFLPADGEYQRVKAMLARRYLTSRPRTGLGRARSGRPHPAVDRVAARLSGPAPRRLALGKLGKADFSRYLGEDPLGYAAMTARKVGRMWSAGIGEAMSSTAGRVIQVVLVLLALAGLGGPRPAAALVGPGRDGDPDRDRHRRRRRLARGPRRTRPGYTRVSTCRGSPGEGRRSPILLGLMDLVGAGIFPAELTALRSAGLIAAAALVVYALARRHSLRNVDVLILLASGVGLAIAAGTEVTDELL